MSGVVYGAHTPHLPSITGGIRFGLLGFRSLLLTQSLLISLPLLIMMLRFSRFPHITVYTPLGCVGFLFGHPGVSGYLHLTRAYGSLSPPSSVPESSRPVRAVGVLSGVYF